MKKTLLLLVLSIELFANWNVDRNVNILDNKAKIEQGIGTSKIFIPTSRYGLNGARFDGWSQSNRYNPDYLAQVSATIDDVVVFDAALSPYLAMNPIFKFGFIEFSDSDDIVYVLTDNHGEKIQQTFKIDRKDSLKNQKATIEQKRVKPIILNPKAWEAVAVDSAIESVFPHYASRKIEETETQFERNDINFSISCPLSPFNVFIKSNIDLRRIGIFSTTTPKPLLAFIQMPDTGFVDIKIPFQLDKSGELFFIGEGKDNKLYRSKERHIAHMMGCEDPGGEAVHITLENKSHKKEIK